MKCDRKFFITTVRTKHPAKHVDSVILPDGSSTTFMLDTAGEANYTYNWKLANASHIWKDGVVIMDSDHLFTAVPTPSYATGSGIYTVPPGQTVVYNISPSATYNSTGGFNIAWPDLEVSPDDEYKTKATNPTKKCECGAHSVGSNEHRDYCELFTKESA